MDLLPRKAEQVTGLLFVSLFFLFTMIVSYMFLFWNSDECSKKNSDRVRGGKNDLDAGEVIDVMDYRYLSFHIKLHSFSFPSLCILCMECHFYIPLFIYLFIFRILVATWNVGGKSPPSYLNLEDWLHTSPPADIYVLGYISCQIFNCFSQKT